MYNFSIDFPTEPREHYLEHIINYCSEKCNCQCNSNQLTPKQTVSLFEIIL